MASGTQALIIGNVDFTGELESMTISQEVLLSSKSGRTARGNNVVDIVNRKTKLSCSFCFMDEDRIQAFLEAVYPYVLTIQYLEPRTNSLRTMSAYIGTPEIPLKSLRRKKHYDGFTLSFIEM